MKNIHIIQTDKPSRLYYFTANKAGYYLYTNNELVVPINPNCVNQNIYITSDEEIKEGDYRFNTLHPNEGIFKVENQEDLDYVLRRKQYKKIILTIDVGLIKDGVQAIDDEFLEWFFKNPSCESVDLKHKDVVQYGNMTMYDHNGDGSHYFCKDCEVETSRSKEELLKFGVEYYKIIIPKEEPKQRLEKYSERFDNDKSPIGNPETWGKRLVDDVHKQETLEEACSKVLNYLYPNCKKEMSSLQYNNSNNSLKSIAKWQQERSYNELELFINEVKDRIDSFEYSVNQQSYSSEYITKWFEHFKKK